MVQQLMDMGGGNWDKDTVQRALRAAYNNPERAVEYLYSVCTKYSLDVVEKLSRNCLLIIFTSPYDRVFLQQGKPVRLKGRI